MAAAIRTYIRHGQQATGASGESRGYLYRVVHAIPTSILRIERPT